MKSVAIILLASASAATAFAQPVVQPAPADPAQQAKMEAVTAELVRYPSILTIDRPEGRVKGGVLTVTSTTFEANGDVPLKSSGFGGSTSPQVSWTKGPAGTKSYVIIYEDGVANRARLSTLHWLVFNIPASVTSIAEGASVKGSGLKTPIGTTKEGGNIDNTVSYTGMGGGPTGNNYRMQVFALDKMLPLPSGASREEVWEAMAGHVLASGDLWSYFRSPPPANPPEAGSPAARLAAAGSAFNIARAMNLPSMVTINRPQGQVKGGALDVTAPSFTRYGAPGVIPIKHTSRGASVSPEVVWTQGPKSTKSYAVMVEDGYVNSNREADLYWLVFDIPPSTRHLAEGAAAKGGGFKQGANKDGAPTYVGMGAMPGAPAFNYHVEVFALDKTLGLPAGASRAEVWKSMAGHVLARGEFIGFYQAPNFPQAFLPPVPRHP